MRLPYNPSETILSSTEMCHRMTPPTKPSSSRRCAACVATAKGPAAIATIELYGPDALAVLKGVFRSTSGRSGPAPPGQVAVGWIVDGSQRVDQVVLACENPERWAIHCHGSPLLVERIVGLLIRWGVHIVPFEVALAERFAAEGLDPIGIEGRLAQARAVTPDGVRLIASQSTSGLGAWARGLLSSLDAVEMADVHRCCREVLARSRAAAWMLQPCIVAIIGPPNSGKSTLLNALAGRTLALVADYPGTTRDYVTATCRLESLVLELTDTAGLDTSLPSANEPDQAAQEHTRRVIERADLLVWVADAAAHGSAPIRPPTAETPAILVWNKTDLAPAPTVPEPSGWAETVGLSALTGQGLDRLAEAIRRITTGPAIPSDAPVVFTDRQRYLVEQLAVAPSRAVARDLLKTLLEGPLGGDADRCDPGPNPSAGRL